MNIKELFNSTQKQMAAELEAVRSAVQHPGLKGTVTEDVVRNFLKNRLPENLGLTTGILVDSTGKSSKQLDIIVYDKAKTPKLFFAAGIMVIPIECAYAVIEVKTQLNQKSLQECQDNMLSVKSLERKAYTYKNGPIIESKTLFGEEHNHWQTMYFVFALESELQPKTIVSRLKTMSHSQSIKMRIDTVMILNRGVITNIEGQSMSALPTINSSLAFVEQNALLCFYGLMSVFFFQASIPSFNFLYYMSHVAIPATIFDAE